MTTHTATRTDIDDFLAQRTLALVGASRSGKKFGNALLRELTARGYEVQPVHHEANEVEGLSCVRSLRELPAPVGGVVIVVPPAQTLRVVEEAIAAGIPRVWMQQGSESPDAVRACRERGVTVVERECLLMFLEPAAWFHRAHRWVRGVTAGLPR